MTATTVDAATGNVLVGGRPTFPLGLSDPPPVDGTAPGGGDAWAEIARARVSHVRNYTVWTPAAAGEQVSSLVHELDAASRHGLQVWTALAGVDADLSHESLLTRIVAAVKAHPGLGAWKGADEPAHGRLSPAALRGVYERVHALDPDHPLVLIEAPRGPAPAPGRADTRLTATAIAPYAAACDIHGIDIYPVSRPPGAHAGRAPVNTDISVVGDMTRLVARATRRRSIWVTLQIAWSGVLPPHPLVFPTLPQARFMAYDAVVGGARGLFFFGGHLKQAMTAADRRRGWNWTYWQKVQRPLLEELGDSAHMAALTAPLARRSARADAPDVAVSTRRAGGFLYVIAVRRSPTARGIVRFTGLPAAAGAGTVLAHPGGNPARAVTAAHGAFSDPSPFAPHNARVYRFALRR